jgi:hypothetical protein
MKKNLLLLVVLINIGVGFSEQAAEKAQEGAK